MPHFVDLWEYTVREGSTDDFLAAYGPDGAWVRLFRQDPGYVRTALLRDASDSRRFVSIDFWRSREARDRLRREYEVEYRRLDRRCAELTEQEACLGEFDVVR